MRKYIYILLLILSMSFFSCKKFLEPANENSLSIEELEFNPAYAEGLLMNAYAALPNDYTFGTDLASDDAASNDLTSVYRRMATGEWKSTYDPIAEWTTAYTQIYYINAFLDIFESVNWSQDKNLSAQVNDLRNNLHLKRLKGEAYALRALYEYKLLQNHGGKSADGRLLGFPIIDKSLLPSDNWKLPRNTYTECVNRIFTDLDTAIVNLPKAWVDGSDVNINAASGARYQNRINGYTAMALKARVALLAASPSFANSGVTWAQAATIAGDLLKELGALYFTASVYNGTFYKEIKNKEIIWNRAYVSKRTWEQNNFPPSLYGYGITNPSQNLVDAFPMKNGYPINHNLSGYNPLNPYANRVPILSDYIVYNGSSLKSTIINTYVGASLDGINVLETSTRTGYYLKKLMAEGVKLNTTAVSTNHNYTLVRMTEVLLNYVEAANEAWGLDGDFNGYGFTARDKIRELRLREGVTQPDAYLATITDANGFRDLIRNERRINLCFEGFRFWDIRRWGDAATMQTPVIAAYITKTETGTYTFSYTNIEERKFTQDMIYGPIPYNETLKYNLDQNIGW